MLNEADTSINCMKEYNKVMKVEQKEAEEFLDNVQGYWLEQRKVTWLEIYLFTILAFGCLFGGLYA